MSNQISHSHYPMVEDWTDEFENQKYTLGVAEWLADSLESAVAFRDGWRNKELNIAYGTEARQDYDLFMPEEPPKAIFFYIHGGYWRSFDKNYQSQVAKGALDRQMAVVMAGYRLCPNVKLGEITQDIANCLKHVAKKIGDIPIIISGHSAGGHLACRMICEDMDFSQALSDRIRSVIAISGLFDLRPLLKAAHNLDLRLDLKQAIMESPALLTPKAGVELHAWVGGNERPEFIRQSQLIANIWAGLGATTHLHIEAGRHHFSVTDALKDKSSALMRLIAHKTAPCGAKK